MKGYLSIVKYYPDTNRDEGFGIGIILISEETNLSTGQAGISLRKISSDRLKRINSAYGVKKSQLIEMVIEEVNTNTYDKKTLDYLSIYENGNLRYSKPQIIECENLIERFDELYFKFAADYYEENAENLTVNRKDIPNRLGLKLRKNLKLNKLIDERLNIGYEFKENSISKFLIGNSKIDFIGGNGVVYAGEIVNLDLNEESLQKSFNKTLALFEAISKSFPNRFEANECKLLVLEEQARNPEKSNYMDILNTWHREAKYGLVIQKNIEDFQQKIEEDVQNKNIIRFDEWLKKIVSQE